MQWKTEVGGEGILRSHSVLRLSSGLTGPKLFSVIIRYKINYSISDLIYKHQVEKRSSAQTKIKNNLLPFNGLSRKSFYISLRKSKKWTSDKQPCK